MTVSDEVKKKIHAELEAEAKEQKKKKHFKHHANGICSYTGDPSSVLDYWIDITPLKAEKL